MGSLPLTAWLHPPGSDTVVICACPAPGVSEGLSPEAWSSSAGAGTGGPDSKQQAWERGLTSLGLGCRATWLEGLWGAIQRTELGPRLQWGWERCSVKAVRAPADRGVSVLEAAKAEGSCASHLWPRTSIAGTSRGQGQDRQLLHHKPQPGLPRLPTKDLSTGTLAGGPLRHPSLGRLTAAALL